MALRTNLNYVIGETWVIDLYCNDGNGAALDLTGGDVQFRIATQAAVIFDLNKTNGVEIQPGSVVGLARITVTPAMQAAEDLPESVYLYEGRALLQDGSISDQTYGNLTARCSLFARFP